MNPTHLAMFFVVVAGELFVPVSTLAIGFFIALRFGSAVAKIARAGDVQS